MTVNKGKIGVTSENIFPIIKKFLYSDHEIFLRELVSNAVDATQKLRTLSSVGDFKGELGDLTVHVKSDDKTITISDRGIGMTAEEVDKYINQIALSSAEEFLEKYKDDMANIIGHFGLGFYSAFMVANQVEIITKSYKEGASAVRWVCDGSPEYELTEIDKEDRGTDIILHIDEENKDYLENNKIQDLLTKFCRFLPIPIAYGKKKEYNQETQKWEETEEPNIINITEPAWTKKPVDLKDEDYLDFFSQLYPMSTQKPLFWIHLNVDYPFKLTGILFFPEIKDYIDPTKDKIKLYSNQVFVTDSVEGIVPNYLMLLHGVIDSPDIPLNVSRSYLQADRNVKTISNHIAKKVADRLVEFFKNDRTEFENKWEDLKLFVHYGMLSDEKFYDRLKTTFLLKDVNDKYYTLEEYKTLISTNQTDKDDQIVILYCQDKDAQYAQIKEAEDLGYNVLYVHGHLDLSFLDFLEQKDNKIKFLRVDSQPMKELIRKNDNDAEELKGFEAQALIDVFLSRMSTEGNVHYNAVVKSLGEQAAPLQILQHEYMRRMKDLSDLRPDMAAYMKMMPTNYMLTINSDHPHVKGILEQLKSECSEAETLYKDYAGALDRIEQLDDELAKKDLSEEDKKQFTEEHTEKVSVRDTANAKMKKEFETFAEKHSSIAQLVDLALLQAGLLKGKAMDAFIKRALEFLK